MYTCCFWVLHFQAFFANRACINDKQYVRALEWGAISLQECVSAVQTALFSSLQVLQATKESGLSYNVGFLTQLVGKRVGRSKCGPNPQKVGHLVCLQVE